MADSAVPIKDKPSTDPHGRQPTTSELFSDAKVVSGAAQAAFGSERDKIDKVKVAGAAENILGAASKYGKLEENKGVGQYVEKAEGYLHKYHADSAPPSAGKGAAPPVDKKEEAPAPASSDEGKSGGGFGGAVKMAQGLFK